MPILFPFVADGVKPTALYSCWMHVIVIVWLQLASTCPPDAEGTLIGGASAEVDTLLADAVSSMRKVVRSALGRENIVVGCTSSTCPCRCSGRLYPVVRTIASPLSS